MEPNTGNNLRLDQALAGILTVAFLGFVFAACGAMLLLHGRDIYNAVTRKTSIQAYLPENPDRLDRLQARVSAFTAEISEDMWLKDELGYVNSAFQYALGKRMINTGSQNMVRLTTGHLYDLMNYIPLEPSAREIVDLRETMLADYPFIFVYEHPTLYDPAMLPEGYAALDHSREMADEVVAALRAGGIDVLDSRDVLLDSGIPLDELLMVTDQHWSTLAAITMARAIAGEINTCTGAALDPDLLAPERLNTLAHEKLFLGKYGQRLGVDVVEPDDIVEYWPKYDTWIRRHTKRTDRMDDAEGPFREAVTRFERLEPDPGKTWNKLAYTYYGQTEPYSIFNNEDAPDLTILLLKDSYSAPIATFMSLLARNVVAVDLRKDVEPLKYWVETYRPDVIVMAYSLQMLRNDDYVFNG